MREWYRVATEVEIDVMEFHEHNGQESGPIALERNKRILEGEEGCAPPARGGKPRQNLGGCFAVGRRGIKLLSRTATGSKPTKEKDFTEVN